jgi:hypothetical protein
MRTLTLLGVHRCDGAILALDQVHFRDNAEAFRGKRHRTGGKIRPIVDRIGRRQLATAGIDADVSAAALLRIPRIRPFAIDPFKKGKPRTIHKLVDHARRHQWRLGGGRRSQKLQRKLGGAEPGTDTDMELDIRDKP